MQNTDYKTLLKDTIENSCHNSLIVINSPNNLEMEELITPPFLSIDLNSSGSNSLKEFIKEFTGKDYEFLLLKSIDNIPENSMKEYWESIITIGLKGEEYPIMVETKEGYYKTFNLPFDKIKLIATCKQYPDFLKDKGTLGYILDFSNSDSSD